MTAPLRPADLAAGWPDELLDLSLVVVSSVDSTQRLARTILDRHLEDDEEPPPTYVVALEQTAGRGRRARRWESAPGKGLWGTLLAPIDESDLASLPIRLGLETATALDRFVHGIRLKWPNDLLVDGRKLVGTLIEVVRRGQGRSWVICGVGVNLFDPSGGGLVGTAASLRGQGNGSAPELPDLVGPVARAIWRSVRSPAAGWREAFLGRCAQRMGDRVRVELDDETVEGTFAGLDEQGAALLDTDRGRRIVSSGDLFSW